MRLFGALAAIAAIVWPRAWNLWSSAQASGGRGNQ
jgi:hypothetical protein